MSDPLVSIITNTYNSAIYIRENVESVLNQSYQHWEQIIIDCGSTDSTLEILEKIMHDRLRVFTVPFCGVGEARNFGIKKAKGDVIAILDSDDVSFPERIATQVNVLMKEVDVLAVATAIKTLDVSTKKEKIFLYPSSPKQIALALRVGINILPHSSLAFRLDAFNEVYGYSKYSEMAEDFDLLLRLSDLGLIKSVPIPLAQIAVRSDSNGDVYRPKGRDSKFYIAWSIISHAMQTKSDEERKHIEDWLDGLTGQGIGNLLWYWQFRSFFANLFQLDFVTVRWFLRSLVVNFHASLFGLNGFSAKILLSRGINKSYVNSWSKR